MKRFCLWLTAGFVLFSVSGGFAKEETLPPDLANLPPDTIYYDKYDQVNNPSGQPLIGPTDYWIGVYFVVPPSFGFTIGGAEFKVNNELLNIEDTAHLYLVKNKFVSGNPRPDFDGGFIQKVKVFAPFNRLQGDSFSSYPFVTGDIFWIVLGPVPGGPDDSLRGQGWWAFSDYDSNASHSYVSFGDSNTWVQRPASAGNFVIRARGTYSPPPEVVINEVMFNADTSSPDPARNHEWVELYNRGGIQTTSVWKLLDERNEAMNIKGGPGGGGVGFPGGYYLVVHFGAPGHTDGELDSSGGRIDLYKAYTDSRGFFNDRQGGCALHVGVDPYISYMGWNLKNLSLVPNPTDSVEGAPNLEAVFELLHDPAPLRVKRIQPTEGVGPLLTATAGISIGLDSLSDDSTADLNIGSESAKMVTFLGGPDAAGPTMGRRNLLPMDFNTLVMDTVNQTSSWMIMLYVAGDYGDSFRSPDRWYFDLLNQIEQVLPPAPRSVNVAVLYDARRGRVDGGNISPLTGATFRGTLKQDITSDQVQNLSLTTSNLNTGATATLSEFIKWAKDTLPSAGHYILALKGDGAGWEGLCGDEGYVGAGDDDRLEMGELKSALQTGLGGDTLDLLILDAPLMSQLEVAAQVKNFAHIMVASPEMTGPADLGYARLVKKLVADSTISGTDLANFVVNDLDERLKQDAFAVWTATNLDGLSSLLVDVNALAINLTAGVKDTCGLVDPSDNYQLKIRSLLNRATTDHYGTQAQGMADFVDLRRLATALKEPPYPSTCTPGHNIGAVAIENHLTPSGSIIKAIGGGGTKAGGYHSTGSPGGLSIYFPSSRQKDIPINSNRKTFRLSPFTLQSDHPFDSPGLETEGGVSQVRRIYAADASACYPHSEPACQPQPGDTAAQIYPHPPAPNFDFVQNYSWDEFLIRYYKPVADAGRSITKRLHDLIPLNASGTSDPDDDQLFYFWDLSANDTKPACTDSLDDLNRNCIDEGTDEADVVTTNSNINVAGFPTPGDRFVWLHVWDGRDRSLGSPWYTRGYNAAGDSVKVQIEWRDVQFVPEDQNVASVYTGAFGRLRPGISPEVHNELDDQGERELLSPGFFTTFPTKPHIVWSTGLISPVKTFPPACRQNIDSALNFDSMGVWICGPLVGLDGDTGVVPYFDSKGIKVFSGTTSATSLVPLVPLDGDTQFLYGLGTLELKDGTQQLESLSVSGEAFPILQTNTGKLAAAALVVDSGQRGIVYCAFGLEQLENTNDIDSLMQRVLGWLSTPIRRTFIPPCPLTVRPKGDYNCDSAVTSLDVVKALNCVYLGVGDCDISFADVTCDSQLTSADISQLLKMAYIGPSDSLGPACYPSVFKTEVFNDELDKSLPLDSSIGFESEYEGIFRRRIR